MKFEPQTAYPYPVLRPNNDDYLGVEFQSTVDFTIAKGDDNVTAKARFDISSEDIMNEIEKGTAAFFLVFACRSTYYRKTVASTKATLETSIPIINLKDEVRIESYVVATQDINSFTSQDINAEFGEGPFMYKKGYILAQDEHQVFYIDKDVFKPVTSVFDLIKNDSLIGSEWKIGFDQDHVEIAVSPDMKEKIDSARNSASNKAVLINSIYFASVMQAIQMLKEGNDYDDYQWARVIRRQSHNSGIDIGSNLSYYSAERLMKLPLSLLDTYVFKGD